MDIAILGSGSWGCALGIMAAKTGHDITLWSPFEEDKKILSEERGHPALRGVLFPDNIHIHHHMQSPDLLLMDRDVLHQTLLPQ